MIGLNDAGRDTQIPWRHGKAKSVWAEQPYLAEQQNTGIQKWNAMVLPCCVFSHENLRLCKTAVCSSFVTLYSSSSTAYICERLL